MQFDPAVTFCNSCPCPCSSSEDFHSNRGGSSRKQSVGCRHFVRRLLAHASSHCLSSDTQSKQVLAKDLSRLSRDAQERGTTRARRAASFGTS